MPPALFNSLTSIPRRSRRKCRRRGVILMVVLALLTLFAIVGLTFVFYGQSQRVSLNWRQPPETLVVQSLALARDGRNDLTLWGRGEGDFSATLQGVAALEGTAAEFQADVRAALPNVPDPEEQEKLRQLDDTLQKLLEEIKRLRSLIFQLLGSQ